MDFTFTDEQNMLLDTTRRFVGKDYDFATRREIKDGAAHGLSPAVWQGFADLGLLGLLVPEADDGLGGSTIDTMLVMTVMGEALVLEPYLASAVLATTLVARLGNPTQRAHLLPALMAGELIAVPALDEAGSRFDWREIATHATVDGDGFVLHGHKCLVVHAASAQLLLVSARMPDGRLGVIGIPRDTAGVRLVSYQTVDGVPASEVFLVNVKVARDAMLSSGDAESALSDVRDLGLAAVCAEAVGIVDKLLAATVAYARDRQQFGVPIGKFQALQHRMADMVLHIEQARSMSYLAAVRCTDPDLALRAHALSAAKVVIGQACRFVGQQAVQLFGGMGVTDELIVSHYFKRLMAIELQFGSTDQHLEAFAAQLVSA
ncbi:acyl-CoA dehydrogenase family protein [Actimicrobium antarcticum]|uniref:Acyl-CoA dehydrogenase n=1 Tax=Actimicrobium antarcticum TaxID=1051899 RepID=A0ABP7TIQ6_9BURK